MSNQTHEVKFEAANAPDFKVSFVDGVVGGLSPACGRMVFFMELPEMEMGRMVQGVGPEMIVRKVKRQFLVDARMSPETYKQIAQWMMRNVEEYEKLSQSGQTENKPMDIPSIYQ